ncbi:MAG: hypothetical protein ABFS56_26710 [Pseudomonadota bacterium]
MKKVNTEMDDELRSEYDLRGLRVRKLGPERKSFGGTTVRLEPDVAEVFPNSFIQRHCLITRRAKKNSTQCVGAGIPTQSVNAIKLRQT